MPRIHPHNERDIRDKILMAIEKYLVQTGESKSVRIARNNNMAIIIEAWDGAEIRIVLSISETDIRDRIEVFTPTEE